MADSLSFKFNPQILGANSSGSLLLSPPAAVLTALAGNAPFPAGPVTLAQASLQTQGGKDIVFGGDGKGNATFSAGAASSLAINADPAQVVASLDLADPLGSGLSFPAGPASSWAALLWSYDLQGSAKGSVGLGSGVTVNFGADGKKSGAFALLHRYTPDAPSREVIADLVASWRLPRQVTAPGDLRPGTWLVAEIDGSLSLSLGVQYGYLFNWLRQVEGKLAGDVALRLQLGLEATIGFTASGRYAWRSAGRRPIRRSRCFASSSSSRASMDGASPSMPRPRRRPTSARWRRPPSRVCCARCSTCRTARSSPISRSGSTRPRTSARCSPAPAPTTRRSSSTR